MKKATTVVMIMTVVVLAWGTANAAETVNSGKNQALYNGITYFDLGPASTCNVPAGVTEPVAQSQPFNGITVFDLGQSGSGAKGDCANRASKTMTAKFNNGITAF